MFRFRVLLDPDGQWKIEGKFYSQFDSSVFVYVHCHTITILLFYCLHWIVCLSVEL